LSALLAELREAIALEGPLTVERYMALCLGHPVHGYYIKRDPFGQSGDFITAPEISQMFGEMIGVWAASVWTAMGRPAPFLMAELGPGRGTLMADLMRAGGVAPGFREAARIALVETSPTLRKAQDWTLGAAGVSAQWFSRAEDMPEDLPAIIVANEFLDALPIRQFVFHGGAWRERLVGLNPDGGLAFGLSAAAAGDVEHAGAEGDIREICPEGLRLVAALSRRIAAHGGALLSIDYGYARGAPGDSLQAVKAHRYVDPLEAPGEADLTAHVDFSALAAAAQAAGAASTPLLTQKTLLERLGIATRAGALTRRTPERGEEIKAALKRLTGTGEGEMGTLFKALAIASSALGALPAFDAPDPVLQQMLA
jgi:NADH dehydrogenase [ubiquinone] 1 alpha subcomplex assembly factor 7